MVNENTEALIDAPVTTLPGVEAEILIDTIVKVNAEELVHALDEMRAEVKAYTQITENTGLCEG